MRPQQYFIIQPFIQYIIIVLAMKTLPLNRFLAAVLKTSRLSFLIKWFNR